MEIELCMVLSCPIALLARKYHMQGGQYVCDGALCQVGCVFKGGFCSSSLSSQLPLFLSSLKVSSFYRKGLKTSSKQTQYRKESEGESKPTLEEKERKIPRSSMIECRSKRKKSRQGKGVGKQNDQDAHQFCISICYTNLSSLNISFNFRMFSAVSKMC